MTVPLLSLVFVLLAMSPGEEPASWPVLPRAVASFGAATADHWLYIYGGHTGKPHQHSTANVSGDFARLNLADGRTWEALPGGPALQSPALVPARGGVLRIGGMAPRNAPGEKEILESTAEVSLYDPLTRAWRALPPLPEPRSSHDAATDGRFVYVAGGWTLASGKGTWLTTAWQLDVEAAEPAWEPLPSAPFERRAGAVVTLDGKLYFLGGIDSGGKTTRRVDVLDLASRQWSEGPDLPFDGFGVAALVHGGRLFASAREGVLCVLEDGAWKPAARLAFPRFFHRLVSRDSEHIAAVGGSALDGTHLRVVEAMRVAGKPDVEIATFAIPYPGAARNRQGIFADGRVLHLFGGNTSASQHDFEPENFVAESWCFDLGTLQWSRGENFPVRRQSIQTIEFREPAAGEERATLTRIAVGGFGHDGEAAVSFADAFALERKGSWTRLGAVLPEPRTQFGLAYHGGSLYAFGGLDYDPRRGKEQAFAYPERVVAWNVRATAEEASAASDSPEPPRFVDAGIALPRVRRAFGGAQLGSRYYMVCGMRQEFQLVDECDVYDFETGTWDTIPAPSKPRISPELVALEGKLYLVGGSSPKEPESRSFERNTTIEVYDPAERRWSVLVRSLPVPVEHVRAFAVEGRLLLVSIEPGPEKTFRAALVNPAQRP